MDEETKKAMDNMNDRLQGIEGTLDNFHTLLTNHMTDYSTKFGRMKASIDNSIENIKVMYEALQTKVDSYKWGLLLVASFTIISLAGFVYLAIWAISKLV